MAGDATFEQMWRFIKIYAPDIPLPLAQEFVNNAYLRALRSWSWSGLLAEFEFETPVAKTAGTVSIANGSTTVTGVGTTFTASDVGNQIQIDAKGPYFTVMTRVSDTEITVDRAWQFTAVSGGAYILGRFYVTLPLDFGEAIAFRNVTNNWRLRGGIAVERINAADAQRIAAGQPYIYFGATTSPVTATLGQARFEMWPKATGLRRYSVLYSKKPSYLISSSASVLEPINAEVIKEGALSQLCMWPGTAKLKNPMYNMQDHKFHEDRYKSGLGECWVQDQARNQTMISYAEWEAVPYAPMDATFLQTHLVF
jgi:hypothetical protein